MLRTLRLQIAGRPDYDLAFEPAAELVDADPWAQLESLADASGRIPLGDRESCRIEDVVEVSVVEPERLRGPTWERGLQDEDVSAALDENYDPPQ